MKLLYDKWEQLNAAGNNLVVSNNHNQYVISALKKNIGNFNKYL